MRRLDPSHKIATCRCPRSDVRANWRGIANGGASAPRPPHCFSLKVAARNRGFRRRCRRLRRSRQLALATDTKMFFRFHLRHPEQMGQQVKFVESSQPGQSWQCLSDERHSLVRAIIAGQVIGSRPPVPDRGPAPPFTQCFFQKYASESAIFDKNTLIKCATQGGILQPVRQ